MSTIDKSKMSKRVTDASGKVLSETEGKEDKNSITGKFYWWRASDQSMAQEIASTVKFIQTHSPTRVEQLTASTRLYGNSSAFNFIGPALSRSASVSANSQSNRISYNLCASVTDTLVSKIAKNKIIPTFITSGGIWGMQRKAENLSKFTEGMFYDQDIHKKGVDAFRDACVWGTGVVHIFEEEDEIKVERAFPHEFFIDQVESLSNKPRQLHRVKIVDRDVMLAFAETLEDKKEREKAVEAIEKAQVSAFVDLAGVGSAADLITVTESWHLKSGKQATDGLHAICVDDTVIYKEEWERDYFPFAFFNYNKRLLGFWGQGCVERLQNLQSEINRLMILDQKSRWMMASFKILIENGSKVVSQHLNNEVGAIVSYTGTPPQYVTPPPIDPGNEAKLDSLIQKGYQQEGVSQLAASSLKPMGVNSGAALRTYDQIGDDRFLFIGQEMESFYLEIARQMIDLVKEIAGRKKSYKARFPGTMSFEEIDWKDVKLKEDEYVLKAYPTSSLPDDPAGRLETVQEYMQAGLISPRQGRRLLAMPDVEMSDKLANAPENNLCKIIEAMLDDGEYKAPQPYYDLTLARQLSLEYYNYASMNNCPEKNLGLLRRFMTQIDDLTGANQQAAPQAGPQPMANPQPTPTSNMVPNVAQQG